MSIASATTDQHYPIGKFNRPDRIDADQRRSSVATLAALPENLRAAVYGLSDAQVDTPYREGGWTVRQLVHHVADSHMNAYVRTRLALTEDWPTIKPYDEKLWAELPDAKTLPVEVSLELLDTLHRRWVSLLESLTEEQWRCGYVHPRERTLHGGRGGVSLRLAFASSRRPHHYVTKE